MKHIMASLTIGACLVLTSAGTVFAADKKTTQDTGQPGAAPGSGTSCQSLGTTPGNAGTAGTAGTKHGSPFDFSVLKTYSGNSGSPTAPTGAPGTQAFGSNANTFTAISEYDVACANQAARLAKP